MDLPGILISPVAKFQNDYRQKKQVNCSWECRLIQETLRKISICASHKRGGSRSGAARK